ncbi:DNA (cytosine-5-)-methyltransferase [Streptomyces sp. NBC_01615]
MSVLELCAGAGGQALGLEQAGFAPVGLIEQNSDACATLRANRPSWNVLEMDLRNFTARDHPYAYDVDLLAAGLPRVKSMSSVRRTEDLYERDLLKATIWLANEVLPRALLVENVPNLVTSDAMADIREFIRDEMEHLGYRLQWRILQAGDFGVPQDRKQGILVALKEDVAHHFNWPEPNEKPPPTVGQALFESMAESGWKYAAEWAAQANRPAPAIVGGSSKHGGADLGPTGTKRAWDRLRVNSGTVRDIPPGPDFPWLPQGERRDFPVLTIDQVATLQGFPLDWRIQGRKTSRYRQVGHASPPPVAAAIGQQIAGALTAAPQRGPS